MLDLKFCYFCEFVLLFIHLFIFCSYYLSVKLKAICKPEDVDDTTLMEIRKLNVIPEQFINY